MFKFSLKFLNKNKSALNNPPVGNQLAAGGDAPANQAHVAPQYLNPSQAGGQHNVNPSSPQPTQPLNLNEHQAVLNHFKLLLQSGHTQEAIQAQWQRYYNQLGDEEKRIIWQSTAGNPAQSSASAVTLQSDRAGQNNQSGAEKPKTRSFSDFLGIPIVIRGYRNWRSPRPPKEKALASHADQQADSPPTKTNLAEVLPDKSLNYRARNAFTWNSPTAMFDKEESQSIWRQNFKSIVFGLTIGVICLIAWQFSFFNEQYIQPFVQPSSGVTNAQIIISPGQSEISDPAFKIIIPNISLEAPIVSGVKEYKADKPNETEAQYEKRVQQALDRGTVHYPGTQLPGESGLNFNSNVVILGHSASNYFAPGSYKSVFSNLEDLNLGELILVNYDRTQYIYKIYGKQVIKPTQTEFLDAGKYNNTLTLITCHPPGSSKKRLVILAQQINPDPANNKSVEQNAKPGEREKFVPGKTQTLIDGLRR